MIYDGAIFDLNYYDQAAFDVVIVTRSQFQVELFVSPPPREIYFTDIEEEIVFE